MKPKRTHPWKAWHPGFFRSKAEDKVTAVLKALQFTRAINRGYAKVKRKVVDERRGEQI